MAVTFPLFLLIILPLHKRHSHQFFYNFFRVKNWGLADRFYKILEFDFRTQGHVFS